MSDLTEPRIPAVTAPPPIQRLPLLQLILVGLQHVLLMYGGAVAVPLIIGQAAGLSREEIAFLINADLLVAGVATIVQSWGIGPMGIRMPVMMGASFAAVGSMVAMAGMPGIGMTGIFGATIAAGFFGMIIAPFMSKVVRFFPPLVTGIVVLMIGLTLIKVGLISMGGGFTAMGNGTFANGENLMLSGVVLAIIVILNRIPLVWMRSCAIVIALAVGYALAGYLGRLDFTGMHQAELFQVPMPLHFGLGFSWALFIPMLVIYLVTSLEAIGDVTATSKVSRQPVDGPVWMQRIKGGVLVNGANSFLAGIFNTFPSSVFAQNNGVIQLTGIASRHIGVWIAAMLILLGLFPSVAGAIQAVPEPVLGGAAMVMFGAVAASGINILASITLDRRALLIIAVSLALGLGVSQVPEFLAHMPAALRNVLESGVATGGICALLLNWFLPETEKKTA